MIMILPVKVLFVVGCNAKLCKAVVGIGVPMGSSEEQPDIEIIATPKSVSPVKEPANFP